MAQFSDLMSTTTALSCQASRLGTTTPTPLPLRVGALSMTDCLPGSIKNRSRYLPTMIPSPPNSPASRTSMALAKRAEPCSSRRFWVAAAMPMGTSNSSTNGGTIRASCSFLRSLGFADGPDPYADQSADMVPAVMPAGRCLWNSMYSAALPYTVAAAVAPR